MLPNFLIVGAQKSATTTLHYLLDSHPDIYFPPGISEVHFFDLDENFERGIEWYESLFDLRKNETAVGECSPFYMFEPASIPRIKQLIPDVKLIVILRDPIARANSHYWHEIRWGFEALGFEEAIAAEDERLSSGALFERRHYSYVSRGLYSTQINRLIENFGRENLLVLINEELAANPNSIARTCAEFLSVDPDGFKSARSGPARHNAARLPRSRRLQRMRPAIAAVWPRLCGLLDRLNLVEQCYPAMSVSTKERLRRVFSEEPRRLRELVGIDVAKWWSPEAASYDR